MRSRIWAFHAEMLSSSDCEGLYRLDWADLDAGAAVAREVLRCTIVRVGLIRVGEATERSIIWRLGGGGWP